MTLSVKQQRFTQLPFTDCSDSLCDTLAGRVLDSDNDL